VSRPIRWLDLERQDKAHLSSRRTLLRKRRIDKCLVRPVGYDWQAFLRHMAESWRSNRVDMSRERDQVICGWYTNDSWAVVSNCKMGHSSRLLTN
jgi:hypothetical protein